MKIRLFALLFSTSLLATEQPIKLTGTIDISLKMELLMLM